jgi:hypothetical protein
MALFWGRSEAKSPQGGCAFPRESWRDGNRLSFNLDRHLKLVLTSLVSGDWRVNRSEIKSEIQSGRFEKVVLLGPGG